MGVFTHDVLIEKRIGSLVRRSSKPDEKGIEVIEDLLPDVIDRTVALIDDDEIEVFRRVSRVVLNIAWPADEATLTRGRFLVRLIKFLALENGVHALNSTDAYVGAIGDLRRGQTADVVKLRKQPRIVGRPVFAELLLGLFPQVLCVNKE